MRSIRRRRFEGKTDYKSRLYLLESGKPRLVVRKTNRYVIAQIVSSEDAQDKILFGVSSRDLLKKGWPESLLGSLKSLSAAYLTGLMIGEKAKKDIKEAVLDIGLQRNIKKSRTYAVLRGAVDAGLKIPHDPEILPEDEKIESNDKTKEIFKKIKQELENGRERNKK